MLKAIDRDVIDPSGNLAMQLEAHASTSDRFLQTLPDPPAFGDHVVHGQIIPMKALMGGCRTPDCVRGPLASTSAHFTSVLTTRVKRITETVHQVMVLLSSHSHVPEENLKSKTFW